MSDKYTEAEIESMKDAEPLVFNLLPLPDFFKYRDIVLDVGIHE